MKEISRTSAPIKDTGRAGHRGPCESRPIRAAPRGQVPEPAEGLQRVAMIAQRPAHGHASLSEQAQANAERVALQHLRDPAVEAFGHAVDLGPLVWGRCGGVRRCSMSRSAQRRALPKGPIDRCFRSSRARYRCPVPCADPRCRGAAQVLVRPGRRIRSSCQWKDAACGGNAASSAPLHQRRVPLSRAPWAAHKWCPTSPHSLGAH